MATNDAGMRVNIITPDRTVFSEDGVDLVVARALDGEFGIMLATGQQHHRHQHGNDQTPAPNLFLHRILSHCPPCLCADKSLLFTGECNYSLFYYTERRISNRNATAFLYNGTKKERLSRRSFLINF